MTRWLLNGDFERIWKETEWYILYIYIYFISSIYSRSQWPRGLRRRYAAARLLRSWVRIQPEACMFVCCECCVLSGRGLCDELITRPEESYRLCYVVVCDLETSIMRRPWPALCRSATRKAKICPHLQNTRTNLWHFVASTSMRHRQSKNCLQISVWRL